MATGKKLTWPDVEEGIWELQHYARTEFGPEGESAVSELAWYIMTGRASSEFTEKLLRCRKSALLPKIVKVWGCTDDVIRVTREHLHLN